MDDWFETDKRGRLTSQGFLMYASMMPYVEAFWPFPLARTLSSTWGTIDGRYRQATEPDHFLTHDLEYMGMDPMTKLARSFRNARVAFDRCVGRGLPISNSVVPGRQVVDGD